jgi:hypothetical protein
LLVAFWLAVYPAPASAAYIHPEPTYSFGTDGTSGTTISGPDSMAYNQTTKRLYVLSTSGSRHIYGFSFAGFESFPTLGGAYPLEVPSGGGDPQIEVDNTALSTAGNIYYSPDGGDILGYSASGAALSADFEPEGGEKCGVAVDKEGHVWSGNYSFPSRIEEFSASGGGPIKVVDVHGQGSTCHLTFDRATNDAIVSMYSPTTFQQSVWRYKFAEGYDPESALSYTSQSNAKVAVNAVKHVLYIAEGSAIKAYDVGSGSLLEEFGNGGCYRGVAVDDASDTVFTTNQCSGKVQVWKGVVVPDVTTGDPSGNKTVTGSVALAGAGEVTECFFQWRKTSESEFPAANKEPCSPAAPYTSDQPSVSATLPLEGEVTYAYRIVAKNANGTARGGEKTITPHNVKLLKTGIADEIERDKATLHGSFEGNGEPTTYYFEYGTSSNPYAHSTPVAGPISPASGVTQQISAPIENLTAGVTYHFRVVAENGIGISKALDETFTTSPAIKDLTTLPATNVETTTATLNGSLNPDGYETKYYFEYGKTTGYGQQAPLEPGEEVGTTASEEVPLSQNIGELEPGTTYHYRIVASNLTGKTIGSDQTFSTPQAPSIVAFSSQNVTETSAELTARINPNGYETTYYFEYGTTPDYGQKAPLPDGATLPGVNAIEPVVVQITGLTGVTYHFRLVTESEWGKTVTEDQTLDYNPPQGCPNTALRQETGAAYLPDCRAYELVSSHMAGGAALAPEGPVSAAATDPARFAYTGAINAIPGTGEVANGGFGDIYVASRTLNGWTTKYIGIPGYETLGYSGQPDEQLGLGDIPTDIGMDRYLVWDDKSNGFTTGLTLEGSYAPYIVSNTGERLGRLPTNVDEVPEALNDASEGGFRGAGKPSPDFSHYAFSTKDMAFAPGGVVGTSPGSAYDNDIANKTVTVISKTAGGGDIERDPAAGVGNETIKFPAISTDGSHILMSTAAPGNRVHLYMSVDDALNYEVSEGQDALNHGVNFVGMTNDGSRVYFTSGEQLTPDDTDNSIDLYMWSEEAGGTVTRVSTGEGSSGNANSCGAGWIGGCGVEVVPTPNEFFAINPNRDRAFAHNAGDIYFYSPEQLAGAHGFLGRRNLYVYRNGRVEFVTTLEPSRPATRINVSENGEHMALITSTRLTAYDNTGHSEMYSYDPATHGIVCVSCRPDGEPPTSSVEGSQNGLFQTEDGRTFFSTKDALVSRDADGIKDVYEYVNGRPQLISPGTGDYEGPEYAPAGLVGVSSNGVDAYFSTYNTLVPEDENGPFLKFYDARTNGGFHFEKPPAPCAAADECHGPSSEAAAPLVIGTGVNNGSRGNVQQAKRKRRRCKAKRCRHHRKHHRKHHGGGGKNG